MDFPRTERRKIHINMTPLIDVVFLLLIFFMMTANFVRTESLELIMPKAGSGVTSPTPLAIRLDRTGTLFLNGAPVERGALADAVRTRMKAQSDTAVSIECDPEAEVESMVSVLDLVHQAGARNVAVGGLKVGA